MTEQPTTPEPRRAPAEEVVGGRGRETAAGGAGRPAGVGSYQPGDWQDFGASVYEPTDDEVDAWAERERQRRAAWARGPSDEEKAMWAERQRRRRAARANAYAAGGPVGDGPPFDPLAQRYYRESQLAFEGALNWLSNWPFRLFAELVRAGAEWEEASFRPVRRRRIPLDDDED